MSWKIDQNYREQKTCKACKHAFCMVCGNEETQWGCSFNSQDRPTILKEGENRRITEEDREKFADKVRVWEKDHKVNACGICDKFDETRWDCGF